MEEFGKARWSIVGIIKTKKIGCIKMDNGDIMVYVNLPESWKGEGKSKF